MIVAQISNTGEQSAVSAFGLGAKLVRGGEVIAGTLRAFPERLPMQMQDGTKFVFHGEDALNMKADPQPIPRGGRIRGVMLYCFPGVTLNDLMATTTVLEFTVSDMWGEKYGTTSKDLHLGGDPKVFPQLNTEITPARE